MVKTWVLMRSRSIVILHDILVIPLAWIGAFWLRFNLDGIPLEALTLAVNMLPALMIVQAVTFWSLGLYRGVWRFASIPDLMRILSSVLMGAILSFLIVYFTTHLQGFPRSVMPIYAMLLVIFLGGSRFTVRWLKDYGPGVPAGVRVLVVGADQAGEGIVRDLLRDVNKNYKPIAFVDDRSNKQGQEIHGVRVLGGISDIPKIVSDRAIQLIIIAMPSARSEEMRRIVKHCEGTGCAIRTLPGLNDFVSGRVNIDLLREVSLEDLLGRAPVSLDWAAIGNAITHKSVLVTGGGGSIGAELCRQIAQLDPTLLIVVENSEYNLFMLEQEFAKTFPNLPIRKHLCDVKDSPAIDRILAQYHPHIIFHAAAYKHVPLLESQPREAIHNNIIGTQCLAELAVLHKVAKFVLVSSDKAVNPTNIMGATKRVSEMICHSLNAKGKTQFITVRFGNVLGSAGSVVPIFRRQLEQGGPLTVTHPDITRFFMTIPEACQLILQALAIGKGEEIFVLDMGEPIRIQFLAEQMIRLAGKKLNEDIEIVYTGLRPGEKLFEELFHPFETLDPTTHEKIFLAHARELNWAWLTSILGSMKDACQQYNEVALRSLLKQLVPELESESVVSGEPVISV